MNTYKIYFEWISKKVLDEDILKIAWNYLGALYQNGQILYDYSLIEYANGMCALVTVPEDNALEAFYNNKYVKQNLEKLQKFFKISRQLQGENLSMEEPCECNNSSWHVLYMD